MSIASNLKEHCWLTELHSDITRLKEEIRCEFARLRQTLNSREISLLDQVDSIREATTSLLITQQLTTVRIKSKMEECAEYLKQSEEESNMVIIRRLRKMMEDLKIQLKEAKSHDAPVPRLKFARDAKRMRGALLYYGRIESDHQDVNSERSWDLVQEKDACESVKSSEQRGCQSTPCYKQAKEIEDMEFACIESDDDFDFENIDLSQVCKANEICTTTSDCVCDSPCYSSKLLRDHCGKEKILSKAMLSSGTSPSEESGEMSNINHSVKIGQDGTNSVEHLLSTHVSSRKETTVDDSDYMDPAQLKLRSIVDRFKIEAIETGVVESRKLVTMDDGRVKQDDCLHSSESISIGNLHNKLQSIFNQTDDSLSSSTRKGLFDKNFPSAAWSDEFKTPSLICDLNSRLQAIVDGSIDPDVEISVPKKSTLVGEEMAHHEMSSNNLTKDNLFNILHGKIHGILENGMDVEEKMDDMSEIPELVKQDPVADLHTRILHILDNENSVSSESPDISLRKNDEGSDAISILSSRMQSLITG